MLLELTTSDVVLKPVIRNNAGSSKSLNSNAPLSHAKQSRSLFERYKECLFWVGYAKSTDEFVIGCRALQSHSCVERNSCYEACSAS